MPEMTFADEIAASAINLPRAALRLAKAIAYPDLDIAECLNRIGDLVVSARAFTSAAGSNIEKAEALSDFLFIQQGFHGNVSAYDDPRNSYLNEVLERRLGIPISLSVVYLAVAEPLGLLAEGVGMPGHFIVSVLDPAGPIYLDPFHGGTRLSRQDCAQLVRSSTGHQGPFRQEWLQNVSSGAILTRMLNNLRRVYLAQDSWEPALAVIELMLSLHPELPDLLRDMGTVHHRSGSLQLAIDYYQRYLRHAPENADSKAVQEQLSLAVRQLAQRN